jgi:hypothetical protein
MASTGARHLILDGTVEPAAAPVISLMQEDVSNPANGISDQLPSGSILVGHPSPSALRMLSEQVGYRVEFVDWLPILQVHRGARGAPQRLPSSEDPLSDYAFGSRVTALATRA